MTTTDVQFQTVVPVVPVDDLAKAVAFYRDSLGFTPTFQQGDYGGVQRGGVELHLDGVTQQGVGAVTTRINVEGIDALFAELEPGGVVDPQEPLETKPWGTRQFSVRDCCHNRLTFVAST